MEKKSKILSSVEAKQKIRSFCAYQERSHQEVKDKLYGYGLHREDVDQILSDLITEGFLNEERFAKAFAGGKFRMKQWGRQRILHELEARGLTQNCIKAGLKEIDDNDYIQTLTNLIEKKIVVTEDEDLFVKRDKVAKYVIQKGFEADLVWKIIKEQIRV